MSRTLALMAALSTLAACGGSAGSDSPGTTGPSTTPVAQAATLSGVVRRSGSSDVLGGATVSAGGRRVTSDSSGRYEITNIVAGNTTFQCVLVGYDTISFPVVLTAGANSRDCGLTQAEILKVNSDAILVPRGSDPIRGVIIAMGGPVASGFVTGTVLVPENPDLEGSQQSLGSDLRNLARSLHVALLGMGSTGLPNGGSTDARVFDVLNTAAVLTHHPELAAAPFVALGISGGGPPAAGLVVRNSERAAGLVARVPDLLSVVSGPVLGVPSVVAQAGLDDQSVNATVKAIADDNRSRGGLWALVVEPNRQHMGSTLANNAAVITWIKEMLSRRLPANVGDPLVALTDSSGWLGDPSTFNVSAWAAYAGDKRTASWLLSQTAATAWQGLALGRP